MANRGVSETRFTVRSTIKCLSLVSASSDKCVLTQTSGLPIYPSNTTYTIMGWICPQTVGAALTLYSEGSSSSSNGISMDTGVNAGALGVRVFLRNDAGSLLLNTTSTTRLKAGVWCHVAFVDNNGTASVYINGVLDTANYNYTRSGAFTNINDASIGARRATSYTSFFNGKIADVRIYSTNLTQDQVRSVYYQGIDPSPANLKGRYTFDNTATDSSGNGNNGTLTGTTYSTDVPGHMTARSTATNRFAIPATTQSSLFTDGSNDSALIPITPSTSGFALGFWLYKNPQAGAEAYVGWNSSGRSTGFAICHDGSSGINFIFVIGNGSSNYGNTVSNSRYLDRKWFHVVAQWIPGTNNKQLYINGVLHSQATVASMTASADTLYIGRNNSGEYARGRVTNFTFQNTTTLWTQAQIDALYWRNEIPSGALQWSMNDVATDQNGANALTLTGTAYNTNAPFQPRTAV